MVMIVVVIIIIIIILLSPLCRVFTNIYLRPTAPLGYIQCIYPYMVFLFSLEG
jgi:hypothetical protein